MRKHIVLSLAFALIGIFSASQAYAEGACAAAAKKLAVVDTNILHDHPDLGALSERHIVVPLTVIQELDRHKEGKNGLSHTARRVLRRIHEISGGGVSDIPSGNGGSISLMEVSSDFPWARYNLDPTRADHRIIALALELKGKDAAREVSLLTRDHAPAILARGLGLKSEKIEGSTPVQEESVTDGPVFLTLTGEQILEVEGRKKLTVEESKAFGFPAADSLHQNQFIVLESKETPEEFDLNEALPRVWRYRALSEEAGSEGVFYPVRKGEISSLVIKPRNLEQIMAADLLLDPRVQLVSLSGKAGTGKTILALVAGLAQSPLFRKNSQFDHILVTRANQVTGEALGFLPGTLEEKMAPYLQPFHDNLEVIIEAMREGRKDVGFARGIEVPGFSKKGWHGSLGDGLKFEDFAGSKVSVKAMIERITKSKAISMQAIAYSRGRSIRSTLLIIDEAQNLSQLEVKTLLTRAGEGTKVVLLGDITQIDARGLNEHNNGLSIVTSKWKDRPQVGHVELLKGERSFLSELATEL